MKPIYYRPGKLAGWALLSGATGVFLLWHNDDGSLWSTFVGLLSLVGAVAAGACGMDPRPALALDGRSLAIRTLFRRKVVDLSDVLLVSVERRSLRLWGIVPMSRRESLVIRVQGGMTGSQRFSLTAGMLALSADGIEGLCHTIKSLRGSAAGGDPARAAPNAKAEEGGTGFDPDAAIARYLAQKAAAPEAARAAPATIAPRPAPTRPTFGRRVA